MPDVWKFSMNDIVLPVTCYQIKLGLFILLGVTAIPCLIILTIIDDRGILWFYGVTGTTFFAGIGIGMLLIFWCEGKLPRFPVRCKCGD